MYLDPGFGGMLLQVILAIVAAGGAILFSFRKKIKKLFSKNKDNNIPVKSNTSNLNETNSSDDDVVDVLEEK
jgi:hypothetical protein